MRKIITMVFGSHLYGTDNLNSDRDYMGVFMPEMRDILLGRIPKQMSESTKGKHSDEKNTPDDVDTTMYSLHKFIAQAVSNEINAMDMLHAPPPTWIVDEDTIVDGNGAPYIWERIVEERHRFYTNSLKALLQYAKKQAAKYGIKGSRIAAAREVIGVIDRNFESTIELQRLRDIWEVIPDTEHVHKLEAEDSPDGKSRYLTVCGKQFVEHMPVAQVATILEKFLSGYGRRAREAEENKGIDWKAMSHALRASIQAMEIYTTGTITCPLGEAEFLREVKEGKHDFKTIVQPMLEQKIEEVGILAEESNYPAKPDRRYWDNFVAETISGYYRI